MLMVAQYCDVIYWSCRVGQEALRVMYLSMCVVVRKAEREEQSYTALLVARQHWDRW